MSATGTPLVELLRQRAGFDEVKDAVFLLYLRVAHSLADHD